MENHQKSNFFVFTEIDHVINRCKRPIPGLKDISVNRIILAHGISHQLQWLYCMRRAKSF